jgi:ADP-ribosylglycohydrolase
LTRKSIEHFTGCLLGGAVGDALGSPVEFSSIAEIRRKFGLAGVTDFPESNTKNLERHGRRGRITDDTQMTLFTAEGLLRSNSRWHEKGTCHPPSEVYQAYIRWLHTQGLSAKKSYFKKDDGYLIKLQSLHRCCAPGNTCLSALESGVMGTIETPINNSKGCGGLMRVAPVGLFGDEKGVFDMGCEIAATTHGHPTGYLAAGCLAYIVHRIIDGASLRDAIDGAGQLLSSKPGHEECSQAIEQALKFAKDGSLSPAPEIVERLGAGWVAEEALAISLYCACIGGHNFRRGVLLAVNHSGDSDSTGAITGNILGSLLGKKAIPSEWLEELELRHEIEELAQDLLAGFRDDPDWLEKYPGW